MINMKKLISCALIIVLLTTIFSFTTIAVAQEGFKDVTKNNWYYSNLSALTNKNIISGFPDGTFKGNSTLTYDQTIKMLIDAHNISIDTKNTNEYWAKDYIDKATELNWFNNLNITNYRTPISRYSVAVILINSFGDNVEYPDNLDAYSLLIKDFSSIPSQYKDSVLKAYALGIISGYPDGTYKGNNTLTRAESTAILYRVVSPESRSNPNEHLPKVYSAKELFENKDLLTKYSNFQDSIKFENNILLYKDENNNWIELSKTSLSNNMANLSENAFISTLGFISNNKLDDYKLVGAYSNDVFTFSPIKNNNQSFVNVVTSSNNNSLNIEIARLSDTTQVYKETFDFVINILNTTSPNSSNEIINSIFSTYSNYSENEVSKTIDGINIKMHFPSKESFIVEIK